tara:strand:- start:183 stop:494 length:312 start_codon:yes stop_codon:yes gene_type:complete
MAKKRIHQIAKELDLASADILHQAKELGIEVKTASSGLTEEEEELVKLALMPEDELKLNLRRSLNKKKLFRMNQKLNLKKLLKMMYRLLKFPEIHLQKKLAHL